MQARSWRRAVAQCLPLVMAAAALSGCKTLNERYIALEVWKYEKCFGHLPPGFVPPGAAPAPQAAMRPCGQPTACPPAPCGPGSDHAVAAGGHCDQCQGGTMEGGLPPGAIMAPGGHAAPGSVPVGPGGSPGPSAGLPTPAAVTSSRPVVISDEVVLP
jgi:hypothetical protein